MLELKLLEAISPWLGLMIAWSCLCSSTVPQPTAKCWMSLLFRNSMDSSNHMDFCIASDLAQNSSSITPPSVGFQPKQPPPCRTVGVPSLLWCCWPLLRSNIAISGGLIPRSIEGIMGKTWHFTLWFIQLYGRRICSITFEDGASIQLVCEEEVWKVDKGWFDNRYYEMICTSWQIQI